jgi:hypothetical protein
MDECYLTKSDGSMLPYNVRWINAILQCPMGQFYLAKYDGSMLLNNVRWVSAT